MQGTPVTAEVLLSNVAWIRQLARHLVSDESVAEELVQDACVVALERPPHEPVRPRAWFASVVRNLVRQRVRGEGRRRSREEASARSEALIPTAGLVEKVAVQRRLVGVVLDLDEPHRSTLLLRYFEDLPPREMSRRLDVPVATVHSRLKRALAKLREELDVEHEGDRRSWVLSLVPLSTGGAKAGESPVLTLGALLMNAKIVLAAAAVLIGAFATVASFRGETEPALERAPAPVAGPETDEPIGLPEPAPARGGPGEGRREVVPEIVLPVANASSSAPAASLRTVRGRVLDAVARPVAGVAVALEGEPPVPSGRGGLFEVVTERSTGRIVANDPQWVTVREGVHRVPSTFEPIVVIAPSIDLAGEVVDERGSPLQGAKVGLQLPDDFDVRFGEILDSTHSKSWSVRTDEHGKFALSSVPGITGGRLRAVRDGYAPEALASPGTTDEHLYFVLKRPATPTRGALSGRVLDANGDPVPEARVATGLFSVLSDEQGLFHIDLARAVTAEALAAVKEGHLPAILERPYAPDAGNAGWPDFVELVLGGPPLVIRGRVVDPEGESRGSLKLWLADSTPFGLIGMMPTPWESLAAGAEVPPEAIESGLRLPPEDGDSNWSFNQSGSPSTAFWNWKLSEGDGAFEFRGLADRDYRIQVLDKDTLQLHVSDPIPAGTLDAVVEIPAPDVYAKVAGNVRDDRGNPVAGVQVTLRRDPFSVSSRVFGGEVSVTMLEHRETVLTDAEGRFELVRVPTTGMRLVLLSDDIVPEVYDVNEGEQSPEDLQLVVEVRCHLQVELDDPSYADGFVVRDADGERLSIHELSENSHSSSSSMEILGGRSPVVSVSARARTVELILFGEVVDTASVDLLPGILNRVRL